MADDGWSIDDDAGEVPAPVVATTASRVGWIITGLLMAAGSLALAIGWIGVALMAASTIVGAVVSRRFGWGTSSPGWIAFGTLPAIVLAWAAITKRGCPEKGKFLVLDEGDPMVDCSQIVASYLSMSVFFALIAAAGALVPMFARRQRRIALEELSQSRRR